MRADSLLPGRSRPKAAAVPHIMLSRWVNEPYPPLTELLSAHDVARLTRRPRWLLVGLAMIGRFPKRARFRGRAFGWWLSDVLEWMATPPAALPLADAYLKIIFLAMPFLYAFAYLP